MREWINYHGLNIYTIVTKMDYVSKSKQLTVLNNIEKTLHDKVIPFSTELAVNAEIYALFDKITEKV